MTTSQLILMASLYLAAFAGVAWLTRAKVLRIAGALGGAAVFGSGSAGRSRTGRDPRLVATPEDWLLPIPVAALARHHDLMRARLLDYLEGGAPLRGRRAGSVRPGSGSNRPAARLPGSRSFPALDRLLAGNRAGPGRRHDLCLAGSCGAHIDAHRCRSRPVRLICAAALGCKKEQRWQPPLSKGQPECRHLTLKWVAGQEGWPVFPPFTWTVW